MRWRHEQIDLTPEEIERLLPLVRETRPHMERFHLKRPSPDEYPEALFDSLRDAVQEIVASRGFTYCRTGWSSDGETVSVSVHWPAEAPPNDRLPQPLESEREGQVPRTC
jgi:hypothetical protein